MDQKIYFFILIFVLILVAVNTGLPRTIAAVAAAIVASIIAIKKYYKYGQESPEDDESSEDAPEDDSPEDVLEDNSPETEGMANLSATEQIVLRELRGMDNAEENFLSKYPDHNDATFPDYPDVNSSWREMPGGTSEGYSNYRPVDEDANIAKLTHGILYPDVPYGELYRDEGYSNYRPAGEPHYADQLAAGVNPTNDAIQREAIPRDAIYDYYQQKYEHNPYFSRNYMMMHNATTGANQMGASAMSPQQLPYNGRSSPMPAANRVEGYNNRLMYGVPSSPEFKYPDVDPKNAAPFYNDTHYKWNSNLTYSSCYPPPYVEKGMCANKRLSCDEANARMAILRSRDKKTIDGAVSKNANYFKKHFGRELESAENQRWWGNDEI